jgi:predicted small metal-binding protein
VAKELRCADAGFDCDATFQADSEEEIMSQAAEHARTVHGMSDSDLQQNETAIRGVIRDV